ncbi:hypothetical protein N0V86_005744 [Didymella sp. IMI 355093]|nr:hypothetical protein N0V86_005744 [Didymella sp. IMI 355093]
MDTPSLTAASDMNFHDLPAEVELQYSPTDKNGLFEGVTAQDNGDQAPDTDINMVDEQQQALPVDDRLQALYDTYHTSYAFPVSTHSSHMRHASDLVIALLQRHYPASQQYRAETTALGPIADYGINFVLKENGEPDSDTDLPRAKKQKTAHKKERPVYTDPAWHKIEAENMTAFVVRKGTMEDVEGVQTLVWRAHTHLVIVLDDLSTFPRWSRDNVNYRGDVLSDLSGVIGRIQRGHGMLLFGPRLELYTYDANDAYKPVKHWTNPNWRMDMRTTSLAEVDEVLRNFVKQGPVYKAGH